MTHANKMIWNLQHIWHYFKKRFNKIILAYCTATLSEEKKKISSIFKPQRIPKKNLERHYECRKQDPVCLIIIYEVIWKERLITVNCTSTPHGRCISPRCYHFIFYLSKLRNPHMVLCSFWICFCHFQYKTVKETYSKLTLHHMGKILLLSEIKSETWTVTFLTVFYN